LRRVTRFAALIAGWLRCWSMIFSENRCPSPIGVEGMLFGIML